MRVIDTVGGGVASDGITFIPNFVEIAQLVE
jgi:hypothetical protein